LLRAFPALHVVAYEEGFIEEPARFVQRLAAVNEPTAFDPALLPTPMAVRYPL
jgi:hypothetical protein